MTNQNRKTALVTGASSGIGKEMARIHAERGGDLVIVALEKELLDELKTELEKKYSTNVLAIAKDLTHPDAPQEVYNAVRDSGMRVDYLINNAGFGGRGKFCERDWETDLNMIKLNVIALVALTRFFLPDFVKRNSGRILNVSSTASLVPGPLMAVYYATKAFVAFFSNAVAEELHDTHVTVTTLMPGATDTEFPRIADVQKMKMFDKPANPRSVAQDGYDGMIAGKLDVISGVAITERVMLALALFVPKKVRLKRVRRMHEV
ncbi:MAG: SDR family oxidoreductase [Deltaproteobacteria bacterium]|nr:SDR family oxidoreductase [Candidatus Zymogenaceae bacterium]